MRGALPLLAVLAIALLPAAPAPATGATVVAYAVQVDVGASTETATGLLGVPAVAEPTTLVVLLHGYGHTSASHAGHLQALADRGVLAVAMDFRGSGFNLRAGADDTLAAVEDLRTKHPSVTDGVLYSVSMGTAVAPMVLAESDGFFRRWVVSEGLSMLHETYLGASAIAPANAYAAGAKRDIEAECGSDPACFVERSAALRAHEFAGLEEAYLFHGLNDGIVPYNQGRELVAALRASGVAADFTTLVRGEPGGEGTTLTGYAGFQVDGLAGHGTESKDEHTLTAASFAALYDLVEGDLEPASGAEHVSDRGLGTLP